MHINIYKSSWVFGNESTFSKKLFLWEIVKKNHKIYLICLQIKSQLHIAKQQLKVDSIP